MSESTVLGLFQGYGVEIEYMIVDARTLDVAPVSDRLLTRAAGELTSELERGRAAWSNELVLHVVEFKSNGPMPALDGAAAMFQGEVAHANALLGEDGLRLLPTGMHPWMNPEREMRLWPHDNDEIYRAFDRIFDCRGHGWSNLQSVHLNLPFHGDDEFARLHAAIRVVLPALPALAASSPVMDGRLTGRLDSRLAVYRRNCARIPSITGAVIPERVFSRADYERLVLEPMWRDIEPHDPQGTLREEWLNARGAIARFDRMAIEIRVLDVQECPAVDLAVVELIVETVRALCEETWCSLADLRAWEVAPLVAVLDACIDGGDLARIDDPRYARAFGIRSAGPLRAGELWAHVADALSTRLSAEAARAIERIVSQGCLARRIAGACADGTHGALEHVYRQLADCLAAGEPFTGAG